MAGERGERRGSMTRQGGERTVRDGENGEITVRGQDNREARHRPRNKSYHSDDGTATYRLLP